MRSIKLWWYKDEGQNTGDMITPWVFDKLGVPYEYSLEKEFIGAGSIFQRANKGTTIWGSGVHKVGDRWGWDYDIDKVLAVRGKLTYDMLHTDKSIVLGDPGILLSRFYKPDVEKKYECCVLAHYTNYDSLKAVTKNIPVYNMMVYEDHPIEWIADRIAECECVISSSLHGIVFAHSLGVPAIHLNYTNLYNANAFKFKDYYSVYDSIEYKTVENGVDVVSLMLNNKEQYVPTAEEIEAIQNKLLEVFPYESELYLRG